MPYKRAFLQLQRNDTFHLSITQFLLRGLYTLILEHKKWVFGGLHNADLNCSVYESTENIELHFDCIWVK